MATIPTMATTHHPQSLYVALERHLAPPQELPQRQQQPPWQQLQSQSQPQQWQQVMVPVHPQHYSVGGMPEQQQSWHR